MRVVHLDSKHLTDNYISTLRKEFSALQLREEFERVIKLYFEKRPLLMKHRLRTIIDPHIFDDYRIQGINIVRGGSNRKTLSLTTFLSRKFDKEELIEGIRSLIDYEPLFKILEQQADAQEITKISNQTLRREALLFYGIEKFFIDMNAIIVDENRRNQLLYLKWHSAEEPMKMVKVIDSTTGQVYLIRVPPDMKTVQEAIAWTFNLQPEEYHPIKET
jgi:hypothetical protein